jgi:hypothetical protein
MPFKVTYPDGGVLVSDQIDAELYRSLGCTIEEVAAEPATEPTPEPAVEPEPEATPEKPARRRTAKPAATEGE